MKEELKRMKKALVVVDAIKAFRTEGNMAITDIGEEVDDEIVRLVELFLERKDDVIFLMEGHTKDSVEFNDFLVHGILGTTEVEIIDKLKPYLDKVIVIRKNSTSGFVTEKYQNYIKENMRKLGEIVYSGYCADICVPNVAIPTKMYFNEHNVNCDVIVPENAIETFDAPGHSREEYNNIAKKVLRLNGIKVPYRYER